MSLLKKMLKNLGIKKEPTFIEKIDKWQTEMYDYKVKQELGTHQ